MIYVDSRVTLPAEAIDKIKKIPTKNLYILKRMTGAGSLVVVDNKTIISSKRGSSTVKAFLKKKAAKHDFVVHTYGDRTATEDYDPHTCNECGDDTQYCECLDIDEGRDYVNNRGSVLILMTQEMINRTELSSAIVASIVLGTESPEFLKKKKPTTANV